jgi:hypothetical protein
VRERKNGCGEDPSAKAHRQKKSKNKKVNTPWIFTNHVKENLSFPKPTKKHTSQARSVWLT